LAQCEQIFRQHTPAGQRLIEWLPWEQPVTQRSDSAIVKRILKGDQEACVEFVRQHHTPIYRLLVHLCRDAHMAEDLSQETFLAAWSNIRNFHQASSLGTWLHKIAYRKFIDAVRRSKRAVAAQSDTAINQVQSSSPDPYETVHASEQALRLYRALDRLKPAERDVLVLHYLQGLSYQDVADVLDEPTGTVKWRTSQALENVRNVLEGKMAE
jgi:RNA polymerase sigma-70 factor (ECF subfamily)